MDSRALASKLTDLRQKQRFTDADFKERGLNPSDSRTISHMTQAIHACLDDLVAAAWADKPLPELKNILTNGLRRVKADAYDTEEREFMADEFATIQQALGVDIGEEMTAWFYGDKLAEQLKTPEKGFHTTRSYAQPCEECQHAMVLNVTEEKAGVPGRYYFLGRCENCKTLNIIETPADAGRLSFVNFLGIRAFNTREEALQRQTDLKGSKKK
jgi:hypothetical protein